MTIIESLSLEVQEICKKPIVTLTLEDVIKVIESIGEIVEED